MTAYCENCKESFNYEDYDICLGGYPHIDCPYCGAWIPLF